MPFMGEAPLMIPDTQMLSSRPPSQTIVMATTQSQVIALPYAELAKRPNLVTELRKRVGETRAQPTTLFTLLTSVARKKMSDAKGKEKLAGVGTGIGHALLLAKAAQSGSNGAAAVPPAPTVSFS